MGDIGARRRARRLAVGTVVVLALAGLTVPSNRDLVPAGWYMLFVTDGQGAPSKALWVRVP